MRIPPLAAVLALATGAVAAAAAGSLATGTAAARDGPAVPPAIPNGPPRSCIPLDQARQSNVRSDRVIDFPTSGDRGYRVTLPQDCPELGFERRFAFETSLGELCSTDIITVLHDTPVTRGASCGLAPFQPVTFPRR